MSRTSFRFLAEVGCLVIVAITAAALHFSAIEILLAMGGAFVLVVVVEVAAMGGEVRRARSESKEEEPILRPAPAPVPPPRPVPKPRVEPKPSPVLRAPGGEAPPQPPPRPPVPTPVPEPVRPPEPAPEPPAEEPAPVVVETPSFVPAEPVRWNLFELQSRARTLAGRDPARDEEWSFLFLYLREFADSGGLLPVDFDRLVRESFADLVGG